MPDMITPNGADMVVYVADSQPEAYIVMGRLQSEGIPATVSYEPAGSAYGLTVGALSGYRVMVRAEDYDQAEAILEQSPYEADDEEDDDLLAYGDDDAEDDEEDDEGLLDDGDDDYDDDGDE